MKIAILDPFSGISGDMTLGALLAVGLDPDWLRALPDRLGLEGVRVQLSDVRRGSLACRKVDFEIPPQPHGRHVAEIRRMVAAAGVPESVRERADSIFTAIAEVEGEMHGVPPERVHLHEVGAVDAILDVVGAVWGLELLGVERVYCGTISLGDGFVKAAHGTLPVPAPATLKLLEGNRVRPGPDGSGELVTPTGAALVRVLSRGAVPGEYTPLCSGFGAGTKDFPDRANALRIVLGEEQGAERGAREPLLVLAADLDDMPGEYLAEVADQVRAKGALDVVLMATVMKKGRPGIRLEVLVGPAKADEIEELLLRESTTLGVRRSPVLRRALPRSTRAVDVLGHQVTLKAVEGPDGVVRSKPEFEDVRRVSVATGVPLRDIFRLSLAAGEQSEGTGV